MAIARHGRCSQRNPASRATTPTDPATPRRSPSAPTPTTTARSGAVPRARQARRAGRAAFRRPRSTPFSRFRRLFARLQVRLHPARERGPTHSHEDAGPAIEWFERRAVDDPGPAGDRLEAPAPLAVE